VALAALKKKKKRGSKRHRPVLSDLAAAELGEDDELGSAKPDWRQPWTPEVAALEDLETPLAPGQAGQAGPEDEDDDSWVFWDEQKKPTRGAGNKPRVREPLELPDPLPSLAPPDPSEEAAEGEEGEVLADERNFIRAYGEEEPTIMDVDGGSIAPPRTDTFEELAEELGFRPFLRAALARRRFHRLTPVQRCSMPLFAAGKDFLASAFTGSGKTAAYLLPVLASLDLLTRLLPGTLVAAHYKVRGGGQSDKPAVGLVKGLRQGLAAIEFKQATGLSHRQLVPAEWVVGLPEAPAPPPWEGPARPYALVLVPTRELCEQVHKEASEFALYSRLRSVALFGSSGARPQLRDLAHGADLLVCTPGRLVDLLHRGVCSLDRVKHLVLDEVDRMMELGFGSQLEEIVEQGSMTTSSTGGRQTTFWSATIPQSVRGIIESFLGKQCVWVDCTGGRVNPVPNTIQHVFVDARPPHRALRRFEPGSEVITTKGRRGIAEFGFGKRWRVMFTDGDLVEHKMIRKGQLSLLKLKTEAVTEDRLQMLFDILKSKELQEATVIVFCRRRDTVSMVYKFLQARFLGVVICHGGMSQALRSRNVEAMRSGKAEILVATDIAARGLDMPNITHVVNYELPRVVDEFVHRCGRTGRIGRRGTAVTFITGRESIFSPLRRLVRQQGQPLPRWCNYEGMTLPWRPRWYKVPFDKVKEGPDGRDTWEESREHIEKHRYFDHRRATGLMHKATELSEGRFREDNGEEDEEEEEEELEGDMFAMRQRLQEEAEDDEEDVLEEESLESLQALAAL